MRNAATDFGSVDPFRNKLPPSHSDASSLFDARQPKLPRFLTSYDTSSRTSNSGRAWVTGGFPLTTCLSISEVGAASITMMRT